MSCTIRPDLTEAAEAASPAESADPARCLVRPMAVGPPEAAAVATSSMVALSAAAALPSPGSPKISQAASGVSVSDESAGRTLAAGGSVSSGGGGLTASGSVPAGDSRHSSVEMFRMDSSPLSSPGAASGLSALPVTAGSAELIGNTAFSFIPTARGPEASGLTPDDYYSMPVAACATSPVAPEFGEDLNDEAVWEPTGPSILLSSAQILILPRSAADEVWIST
jgi:hypothetical protein